MSQTPPEARQTVLLEANVSAGQLLPAPSQNSAASQVVAAARQSAVLLPSAGQVALAPVQVSARSHTPADARQTWPEPRNWQVEVQHDGRRAVAAAEVALLGRTVGDAVAAVRVVEGQVQLAKSDAPVAGVGSRRTPRGWPRR